MAAALACKRCLYSNNKGKKMPCSSKLIVFNLCMACSIRTRLSKEFAKRPLNERAGRTPQNFLGIDKNL